MRAKRRGSVKPRKEEVKAEEKEKKEKEGGQERWKGLGREEYRQVVRDP